MQITIIMNLYIFILIERYYYDGEEDINKKYDILFSGCVHLRYQTKHSSIEILYGLSLYLLVVRREKNTS